MHISDVNLSRNHLNDDFAKALSQTLINNDILWRVDISYNPITKIGGQLILKSLREGNESLES